MKQGILKRLEKVEQRIIPKDTDVIVFIEDTEEKGIYSVKQTVYHGNHNKDYVENWKVHADSAQEVANNYKPPEGCKDPIIFMYDFGEEREEKEK